MTKKGFQRMAPNANTIPKGLGQAPGATKMKKVQHIHEMINKSTVENILQFWKVFLEGPPPARSRFVECAVQCNG